MKKVGIVTYYGDNYGACLQAYALQEVINKMGGYKCKIVETNIEIIPPSVPQSTFSKITNRIAGTIKKGDFINRYRAKKYVKDMRSKINIACGGFRNEYIQFEKNGYTTLKELYSNPPQFDIYLSGSDQIWNPTFYGGCNPIYFLDWTPDDKYIASYASSVGVTSIKPEYEADLINYLKKYDAISVREDSTVGLLKKYTDKPVKWVLDPTLLLDKSDYEYLEGNVEIPKEPYAFCYMFGQEDYLDEIKAQFKRIFDMPIVSIPFVKREIISTDIKIDYAGPADFVNLIKNASIVITDSFHATAFSINFQVPFITLLRQSENEKNEMSSRIKSILGKMGLSHRLIRNASDINEDILHLDFTESCEKLEEYRRESMEYLKRILGDNV